MTCREFTDAAESLTPSQLLRMQTSGQKMFTHARECVACGSWLESQRLLGNALQSLSSRTEQREAGPQVEQAVLRAFRTQGFAPAVVVVPEPAAPAIWRLSRFFEIGAYAAVAAALIVGVFLGVRMLRDKQTTPPPAQTVTVPQSGDTAKSAVASKEEPSQIEAAEPAKSPGPSAAVVSTEAGSKRTSTAAARNIDSDGYVALMLCDPLICSGDEQVIRMELPVGTTSGDGSSPQPVIADVVVGEDGLVRAMRIVN